MLTNREHRISYDSTGRLISKEVLDLSVTGNADKWLHSQEYNFLTATLSALNDKNLFAYCDNNPVSRADDGEFWHVVAGAVGQKQVVNHRYTNIFLMMLFGVLA